MDEAEEFSVKYICFGL